MNSLIITLVITPPLAVVIILFALGRGRLSLNNHFLSGLSIFQMVSHLLLGAWLFITTHLPVYLTGNHYLFIDRLALYEILIMGAVFVLAAIYARGYVDSLIHKGELEPSMLRLFYGSMGLLELVIMLGFLSNNLALLWIFLELSTLFSAVLIVTLKAKENIIASLKYVFVASTAMLFAFIGIILLFAISRVVTPGGTLNWTILMELAGEFSPGLFTFAFVFLFVGFAAKSGLVPFHTWLPTAHARAPSVVSALLSGVLLNLGIYGLLRLNALALQTAGAAPLRAFLIAAGVITIAVAAFSMLARTNTKKLVAFSSIEHMGLLVLGIGLSSPLILFWVLFHKLAHSLTKPLLFFSAGILHRQYDSNIYFQIKNVLRLQPLAGWGMIIGSVAIIGTPLFPIFLSKLNILLGLAQYSGWLLFIVLLLLLLMDAAFGYFMVRAFSQNDDTLDITPYRAPRSMTWPIIITIAALLFFGLYMPTGLSNLLHGIVLDLGL